MVNQLFIAWCSRLGVQCVALAIIVLFQELSQGQPRFPEPKQPRPGVALSGTPLTANGFSVDGSTREEVRAFYNTVFHASEGVPLGWTGNISTGEPGTTSLEHRQAVILRVNAFRAMAGVPSNITLNDVYSRKAQQAALLMSANTNVSHFPSRDWLFYTDEAAEAARNSNLSLGDEGPQAVLGQIRDDGANNSEVGHRRWLLFPPTQQMGTGDVPGDADHFPVNALWVLDNSFGARPATRDEFVAWPPPGYVPYPLVFNRWSFSFPDADFSSARVSMIREQEDIPVTMEPVADGVGDNTLVWSASGDSALGATAPTADVSTRVTIDDVMINGLPRQFTYDVIVFDPAKPGPDSVLPVVTGPTSLLTGVSTEFQVQPIPLSSAYQFRVGRRSPLNTVEGAENGLADFDALTSPGYDPVARDVQASGQASFHLATPKFTDQYLAWNRPVLAGPTTQLNFRSRLGWATTNQTAELQISADEGASWTTVYRQSGDTSAGEEAFVDRSIDLSAFAGRTLQLRLAYLFAGGIVYNQTVSGVGWYVDDISWANAEEFIQVGSGDVSPSSKFFVNTQETGDYALQARARVFKEYFLDWSSALPVHVAQGVVPPKFTELRRGNGGSVELLVQAAAGTAFKVESSPDLRTWTILGRFTGAAGVVLAPDPAGLADPHRFYRASTE